MRNSCVKRNTHICTENRRAVLGFRAKGQRVEGTYLGDVIREIRVNGGFSMMDFAKLLGCAQSSVSRYESGDMQPKPGMLKRLLEYASAEEKEKLRDALSRTAGFSHAPFAVSSPRDNISVTEEEWRWINRLLRILRSSHAQPIRAVTENLETFFEFCELADRAGAQSRVDNSEVRRTRRPSGAPEAEGPHSNPSENLPAGSKGRHRESEGAKRPRRVSGGS